MARAANGQPIPVLDSEGVRGEIHPDAWTQDGDLVLIRLEGGDAIEAPRALLRPRKEGGYTLPYAVRTLRQGAEDAVPGSQVVAVIPVIGEEAQIGTRTVETGRIRIQKRVQSEEQQLEVPLFREQVQVERVAADRFLEEPLAPHYRGDTLVIPVMEEVLVVQKRLRLREEIHVTATREQAVHAETVRLQREEVSITRDGSDSVAPQDGNV
jgi:uncharacterized protein (TIGR02271 family)